MQLRNHPPRWHNNEGEGCPIRATRHYNCATSASLGACACTSCDEGLQRTCFRWCLGREFPAATKEALIGSEQVICGLIGQQDFASRIYKEDALLKAIEDVERNRPLSLRASKAQAQLN
jgi:hypothetical protein